MCIKLIIFDFDGTLGDTRRNIVTTMQMAIKEMQLPERSEAECASTIGLPLAGCFKTLFPDIQDELIPRCAETYRRFFNENLRKITPEAFPGVVKTLKILKEKGFLLTIASSRSRKSLIELTHTMGIADYISYLIGADDVKEAKPKPEPVLKTLAAHALGLGAVWTALYPRDDRAKGAIEALKLPDHIVPLCAIIIGYPAEQPEPKDKWKPENVSYNEFGGRSTSGRLLP